MGFAPSVGATGCRGGPSAGAVALLAEIIEAWGPEGVRSLGIYNCRKIAGSDEWSIHSEGRAVDLGVSGVHADVPGQILGCLLGAGNGVLQRIIWDHRVYDIQTPAGREYGGSNPHTDHLHVELSWAAARQEIPLELQLDDQEDDIDVDDVRQAMRDVLNEATPHGETEGWEGSYEGLVAMVQGLKNSVARIEVAVGRLGDGP